FVSPLPQRVGVVRRIGPVRPSHRFPHLRVDRRRVVGQELHEGTPWLAAVFGARRSPKRCPTRSPSPAPTRPPTAPTAPNCRASTVPPHAPVARSSPCVTRRI